MMFLGILTFFAEVLKFYSLVSKCLHFKTYNRGYVLRFLNTTLIWRFLKILGIKDCSELYLTHVVDVVRKLEKRIPYFKGVASLWFKAREILRYYE